MHLAHGVSRCALIQSDEMDASLIKMKNYAMLYSLCGDIMANDKLSEQIMDFAVHIINFVM